MADIPHDVRVRAAPPYRRVTAVAFAVVVLWIALASPLAALHHQLLSVHMVQHVLLMAVAPPLLLMGLPPAGSRPVGRLRAVVMHPIVCWLAPTVALISWHVPAVFQLAVHAPVWHDVQAASFLATGLLFWAPVVRPSPSFAWPRWSIPLYLFTATLPCDALSAFLVFCGRVVYPAHGSHPRPFDLSPLRDQELAGTIMWVAVTLIYVVPAMAETLQLLSPSMTDAERALIE